MRPIIKTLVYRIIAVLIGITIGLLMGVPVEIATTYGIVVEIVHTVWYYLLEKKCEKR
jgi:uncharacterized membrane protein